MVARFTSRTRRISLLRSAGLVALASFLLACGGNTNSHPIPLVGPKAILNGTSLSTATSHWVAKPCGVQIELTSDQGFWSVVTDSAGTTSSASTTWVAGADGDSLTVGFSSGLKGFYWVAELTGITGSTPSQQFTANVIVESQSTPQTLGSCTFVLIQGGLS